MKIFYSPTHQSHSPKTFIYRGKVVASPETPERADLMAAALRGAGFTLDKAEDFGPAPRSKVHTADYLAFLETVHERWRAMPGATDEVVPNAHPGRHMAHRPEGIVGLVGYYTADTSAPITAGTWEAAVAAAHCATQAAEVVLNGERGAYALCRPPGHHAFADMAGGFCFLNNTAIAAEHLRSRFKRVAILDIDVHHGNGTQGIFWRRGDVLTVSIHADPSTYYPWYCGYAEERGEGEGLDANLNLPLAHGSGDDVFLETLDQALARIRRFEPHALVMAVGFDTHERDPLGVLKVTTDCYHEIARRCAALGLPSVLVQQGGYGTADLPLNLLSFLHGFETG